VHREKSNIIYITGVSGAGKSTIGNLLSQELGIPFLDGDDFHPPENISKMSRGEALNDEDRLGWLQSINLRACKELQIKGCIFACSALKKSYREILNSDLQGHAKWVFLSGTFEQIEQRINAREDHFMNSNLLQSQFDILEESYRATKIDISLAPNKIVDVIKTELTEKGEIGLFGLGVMGKSLARNLARNGFAVSLFNRHVPGKEENIAANFKNEFEEFTTSIPFDKIQPFVESLQKPRKIMLMVNSGKTVDSVIDNLLPFLSEGDIIIDGGNSNFNKTNQRFEYLKSKNIHFVGSGVSGGEEGALNGPSIMPGCSKEVYQHIKPFLETIAAKDAYGNACCTHIGTEGSGHFVKMVHNGIEYVEMQLLAEAYFILKSLGKTPDQIADVLESWKGIANSYLLEITIDILRKKDGDNWLIDSIIDKAANKGTGNWTTISSAQLGMPSTMIATALFARYTSFFKEERTTANKNFSEQNNSNVNISNTELLNAYQFARLINHYQGFKLIYEASVRYKWDLNLSELARIWTNGCIIRSSLMSKLVDIFKTTNNLLTHKSIIQELKTLKPSIKNVVAECVLNELPIPNLSESINFLNSFVIEDSSANLIQAQRDYFGAHTYQRKNDSSEKFYHTNWKIK